jgi:hypothetical protein
MKYAREEVAANIEQGFARFWDVYEDYTIVNDSLFSQGKPKYSYAPMVHQEIPSQLAQLKRGDRAGVLRFARTYGSLGYQLLLPPAPGLWKPIGDPLSWIWAHSETIRFCLKLSELLQEQDLYTLKDVLRAQHVTPEDIEELCDREQHEELKDTRHFVQAPRSGRGSNFFSTMIVAERDKVRLAWDDLPNKKDCSNMDRMNFLTCCFRNRIINSNIKGMVRALSVIWHPRLHPRIEERSYWQFTALIETVYWHLADAVDAGKVKRCEDCHRIFIQQDKRQRYCPPLYNSESSKRRHSRCGTRKRVTEHRLRRKTTLLE